MLDMLGSGEGGGGGGGAVLVFAVLHQLLADDRCAATAGFAFFLNCFGRLAKAGDLFQRFVDGSFRAQLEQISAKDLPCAVQA